MLQVRLLGQFHVRRDGIPLTGLASHKVQELFGYLIVHRDRVLPRETLATLLWGESTTAQAKKGLRQVLWQLQVALGDDGDATRVVLAQAEFMRINPAADLSIDIADLEAAFNLCRLLSGEAVDPNIVPQLQAAVDLYVGDLLEGWYQDWCLYERERLQNLYLALLDKLTAYCEAHGEYELGLSYGSRILDRDYARERTHQRLMRLHYLSGDRVAAIRQYEQCVAVLKRELGVRPSRRTVDLYKQICADQLSVLDPPPAAATPPPSLHSLLDQLGLLQGLLADFHRQLREHVEAAEYLPRNGP